MIGWTRTFVLVAFVLGLPTAARAQVDGPALLDSIAGSAPSRPLAITVSATGEAWISFRDTTLTPKNLADSTYMFGRSVSPAEAAGCAPSRFHAREAARQYWRLAGRRLKVARVTVLIRSRRVEAAYFFDPDELDVRPVPPPLPGGA
jgi:hypothetical protein